VAHALPAVESLALCVGAVLRVLVKPSCPVESVIDKAETRYTLPDLLSPELFSPNWTTFPVFSMDWPNAVFLWSYRLYPSFIGYNSSKVLGNVINWKKEWLGDNKI